MSSGQDAVIGLFWKIHPKVYGWTGGRIGGSMMGMPVLLLTTTGRKSGLSRTKALMYLPRGEDFVVIASNLGSDRHPAWWLNLTADPNAEVQVGSAHYAVHAREAEGEEREALWDAVSGMYAAYETYRNATKRRIPVVVLERRRPA